MISMYITIKSSCTNGYVAYDLRTKVDELEQNDIQASSHSIFQFARNNRRRHQGQKYYQLPQNMKSNERKGLRQIIARLKSVDAKFHILQKAKKFQQHEKNKVNEDLTKLRDRLLFHCRQLCRQHRLNNARTSNGKITVKDRQESSHSFAVTEISSLATSCRTINC